MAQTPRCLLDGDPYKPPFGDCAIYTETTVIRKAWAPILIEQVNALDTLKDQFPPSHLSSPKSSFSQSYIPRAIPAALVCY